jgi:hypothetical protein
VSLKAAQILVRAEDRAWVARAAGPTWTVLAPQDGWVCVLDALGPRADSATAQKVSRALDTEALLVEVDGQELRFRLERWERGALADAREEPPAAVVARGEMPSYRDVEGLAWADLRARGVPRELALLHADELREEDGWPRGRAEGGADAVPVRPDVWVEGPEGRVAGELRRVRGQPTRAAADALAAVEEAVLERLIGYLADASDGEHLPALSFTYEDAPEGLALLLDEAREARPLLASWLSRFDLLTRAGFARAARARLRGAEYVREVRGALDLLKGDAVVRVDLDEPYRSYLVSPERLDGTLDECLSAALSRPALPQQEWPLDDLRARLWPTLDPLMEPRLLCADDGRTEPLQPEALARVGLDPAQAVAAALRNMERSTSRETEGLVFYATDAGLVLAAEFPDPSTAARVLSPTVRAFLREQLGGGADFAAAMPHRDAFLAAPATEKGLQWLRAEAARRYSYAPEALRVSPRVYMVREDGLDLFSAERGGEA